MLSGNIKKSNQGFTLIELIIVIVILGILAVTAAPKFLSLSGDAREGVLNGLAGNMKSTASIYHSRALIEDGGLENGFVNENILFDQGYPVALDFDAPNGSTDGTPEILEAMEIDAGDWTFNTIFNDSEDSQTTRVLYITSSSVIANGATAAQIIATNCYVSYESYLNVQRAPVVKVFADGCN